MLVVNGAVPFSLGPKIMMRFSPVISPGRALCPLSFQRDRRPHLRLSLRRLAAASAAATARARASRSLVHGLLSLPQFTAPLDGRRFVLAV
jgi:hypothetical protein